MIFILLIAVTILVTIISILCFHKGTNKEPFGTQAVSNIGNQVLVYIRHSILKAIDKPSNTPGFAIEGFPEFTNLTLEEVKTFQEMPNEVWEIHPIESMWSYTAWPDNVKKYYMIYWRTCGPILRRLFDQVLPKVKPQTVPIVHFRCSDIPFNRHPFYHLPTNDMVEWTCKIIKERGYNSVVFLHCNKHLANTGDKKHCERFFEHYINIYKKNNITVSFQCKSILEDFASMVYSPLLVSLNESSFAFVAGMTKDPANFVSGNNIRETQESSNGYLETKDVDWIYYLKPPILHKDVKDYHKLELK